MSADIWLTSCGDMNIVEMGNEWDGEWGREGEQEQRSRFLGHVG